VAIRELGRAEGLELYEHELKKLFHEVESEQGIEVSELRYLTRRALQTIPKPDPYFKSFWNRVDFLTIVIQLLAIIAQATDSTYRRAGTDRTAAQEVREKEPSCPITEPHMLVEGGLRTLGRTVEEQHLSRGVPLHSWCPDRVIHEIKTLEQQARGRHVTEPY